jgi:D-glucuronyl C5-epimerase C-terminus
VATPSPAHRLAISLALALFATTALPPLVRSASAHLSPSANVHRFRSADVPVSPSASARPTEELGPLPRPAAHTSHLRIGRPSTPAEPAARASISRRRAHPAGAHVAPPVLAAITRLRRSGAIAAATAARYRGDYLQARRTLAHLAGTRAAELGAVLENVLQLASSGELTPSRAPAVFLTLQRNREWWSRGALLSYGARVSFPRSKLVWEYYPGQGIELQWLATFGEANGYYLSGDQDAALRQVLEEAAALAADRAGGVAWEYLFHFDGGSPPWTSGLSEGTAIQAFARGAQRLHEPAFAAIAQRGLGVFRTPPPAGVRMQVETASQAGSARVHYLEYSFAPEERILNGFIQALNGLYDFAKITRSAAGLGLFEEGDADARAEVPHYDTGAWSRYDQHTESDLGYHELLAEFLQDLCDRVNQGPPTPPTPPAVAEAAPGSGGSTPGSGGSAVKARRPAPIPGDGIYCTTASRFYGYLHTPPVLTLLSKALPTNARAGIRFSLSKIATLSLTVTSKGKIVWHNSATVESGRPRLLWVTPKRRGRFTVVATAVDLAGNRASTSGVVEVTKRRRPG